MKIVLKKHLSSIIQVFPKNFKFMKNGKKISSLNNQKKKFPVSLKLNKKINFSNHLIVREKKNYSKKLKKIENPQLNKNQFGKNFFNFLIFPDNAENWVSEKFEKFSVS